MSEYVSLRPHCALRTAHWAIRQFVLRTAHRPWVLTTASPNGPHHACHLGMCAGGLDHARNPERQPLDTLCNLINALVCCRIAQPQFKGTLTVLEQPNTLTGHSHGCLILAIMHGDDMAATIPWRRPWHPLPGVCFFKCAEPFEYWAPESGVRALTTFP